MDSSTLSSTPAPINPHTGTVESTTLPPISVFSPSVSIIRTTLPYADTKLDKSAGNYVEWFRDAQHYLTITGLISYVLGEEPCPVESDIIGVKNWKANDKLAKALILSMLSHSEWDFAASFTTSKECWDALILRHRNEGPICQVELIQGALSSTISRSSLPLTATARQICHAIAHAFKMGTLTVDLFQCIALINALSEFPHLQSIISHDLSDSTIEHPYSAARIISLLENEERLLESAAKRSLAPVALASSSFPRCDSPVCSNCKRPGHTMSFCVVVGGMVGKSLGEACEAQ